MGTGCDDGLCASRRTGEEAVKPFAYILALILELAGYHPRLDYDPELADVLRRWGWRPFLIERVL